MIYSHSLFSSLQIIVQLIKFVISCFIIIIIAISNIYSRQRFDYVLNKIQQTEQPKGWRIVNDGLPLAKKKSILRIQDKRSEFWRQGILVVTKSVSEYVESKN